MPKPNNSEQRRMESDHCSEQEAAMLFQSTYPCAYYVQSPSTLSHATSAAFPSPLRSSDHSFPVAPAAAATAQHQLTLSGYSSSRGSNNSFPDEKKVDGRSGTGKNRLIIVEEYDEEEEEGYYGKKGGWWGRYMSFGRSSSCMWIFLQISWRVLVSFGAALLVFYLATKPPPPIISLKVAGIKAFGLAEGVDSSGVTTKILTCNCSMNLVIDNKSKLFGLRSRPPLLQMSFAHLPLAVSHGTKLYAESDGATLFKLWVATVKKPMYGAGRSMADMLESGDGLPLVVRLSLNSDYRIIWNLIRPKYHHQFECLIVLHRAYDKKHRTQTYNSTCIATS